MPRMSDPAPERLLCKIGVFLPVVGLPYLLAASTWSLVRNTAHPLSQTPWRRWLLALTVAELVVVGMLWLVVQSFWGGLTTRTIRGPLVERRVIGVRMDVKAKGPGARIAQVYPGGPAARAGLKVGDVVISVNGASVSDPARLPELLQEGEKGVPCGLQVRRGQKELLIPVSPVSPQELSASKPGMFESPVRTCSPNDLLPVSAVQAVPLGGSIALLLLLGWWRRPRPIGRYLLFTLVPAASMGVGVVGVAGVCLVLGGATFGGSVFGMLIGEIALLAMAAAFLPGMARQGTLSLPCTEARLSSAGGVGLGLGYIIVGGLRVGIVIAGLMLLFGLQQDGQGGNAALQTSLQSVSLGLPGTTLLFVLGVVVGPAAEEVYFRGGLLPWLATRFGVVAALWISAGVFGVLHAHYGVSTLLAVFYGYVLGWARIRTGRLWAPFFLHAVINFAGGVALLGG